VARPAARCDLDATVGDVVATLRSGDQRVVVTTDDGIVLGVVRETAAGLDPATPVAAVLDGSAPSVRPSIPTEELAESMDRDRRTFVLVTTPDGTLIGVVEREQLLGRD
jgi:CBS domain containing-hemolysin-like protein